MYTRLPAFPLLALWGLANSAAQSLMTQRVSHREQGQLQGANGSLRAIAELIGPGVFSATYACFIVPGPWRSPGAAFYLAAAMMAGVLALAASL